MEEIKIKKIITAIGNPKINNELKKMNKFILEKNDIQYKEGILELLEIDEKIDFIILSQHLPGVINIQELIKKIIEINEKIQIILLIDKYEKNLNNILENKNVFRILCDGKIEINDIIKIINEKEKMEIYNFEIIKEIEKVEKCIDNKKINTNNFLVEKKSQNGIRKFRLIKNNLIEKNFDKNRFNENKLNKNKIIKNKLNKVIKNKINKNELIKKIFLENKYDVSKLINNILNKNEELKKEEKNKIFTILGNSGAGKSIFSIMLAEYFQKTNKKILIIDFDILNNSLHTILGIKQYSEKIQENINRNISMTIEEMFEKSIIKINQKIDLISGINLIFNMNKKVNEEIIKDEINKISKKYDLVIIDSTCECLFNYLKEISKISNKLIFLMEANLSEIAKSNRLLEIYSKNWNIDPKKIKIIFNKYNKMCIDTSLLKKIYNEYDVIGKLGMNENYNVIINSNLKNIILKNIELKKYKKITQELMNA